jgi:lysophospholipase L1-like esterase
VSTHQPEHADDNMMERFDVADERRFRARDAIIAVVVGCFILVVCAGPSIKKAGEQMHGIGRDIVLGIGRPAAWVADQLPFHHAAHTFTAWLSPDVSLNGPGGFTSGAAAGAAGAAGSSGAAAIPPVTPDAFTASSIGASPPPRQPLHSLLVTGDSMSQPLDQDLAQTLDPEGVKVTRDPHLGTGISSTLLVDWGKLSVHQVRQWHPQAVVIFIGANDGFSMAGPNGKQVNCCGAEWAAIYAGRVRQMMNTYRQDGAAHVYWLTLPTPREAIRAKIALVVNAAIEVAAEPYRAQVTIIDTVPIFTPGNKYRDSMNINGQPTIVRESDGIHLNDAGSALAEKYVLAAVDQNFTR